MCAGKVTPPLDANWGRWTTIGGAYRRLLRLAVAGLQRERPTPSEYWRATAISVRTGGASV